MQAAKNFSSIAMRRIGTMAIHHPFFASPFSKVTEESKSIETSPNVRRSADLTKTQVGSTKTNQMVKNLKVYIDSSKKKDSSGSMNTKT